MGYDISDRHTFVVCAYKESKFLEDCVCSVMNQDYKSTVVISTGTPNDYIYKIAEKYGLKVHVNEGASSLANDWNFAVSVSQTELVTLAHQDDIYDKEYSKKIWNGYLKSKNPIILFSDYNELRDGQTIHKNLLLTVKRCLLFPLKLSFFWNNKFIRRRVLSIGSAICCPAVTLVNSRIPHPLFEDNMKSNIDWQAWEVLSKLDGAFVYISKPLMEHRIHAGSTTSELLENSARKEEDLFMFRKFWPEFIAVLIEKVYQNAEKSNVLK